MSLLRVEGLAKKYRSRQVVKDLSLEVARGEVVGLLGPNGAGKTTAFYMIVGLVPTDAGRIVLDGQEVSRLPVHRRARLGLGYLPQEPSVFRKLSVRDNIYAILETRPDLDAERREAMLESLLDDNSDATPQTDQTAYDWATWGMFEVRKQRSEAKQPLKVPITKVTVRAPQASRDRMPAVAADLRAALRVQAFEIAVGEPREVVVQGYEPAAGPAGSPGTREPAAS